MGFKLLIFRPAGMGYMRPETSDWLCKLHAELLHSGRCDDLGMTGFNTYRSIMGRNKAIKAAIDAKCDYLLMVDPDMVPDMYVGKHPKAKHFFSSSLAWLENYPGGMVGAPAVGGRPDYRPNVYRGREGIDEKARELTHEECRAALENPRMEHVSGIGSGLLLMDVNMFKKLKPPWFHDTFTDATNSKLKLGQDMYLCNIAAEAGIKVWCNWYSWAGHIKAEVLGCPGME